MNLREENNAGFLALLEIAGEPICLPGYDKPVTALITRPEQSAAFMLGIQVVENSMSARIDNCFLSAPIKPQTFATIDGRKWKITKVNTYAKSTLLELGDAKN